MTIKNDRILFPASILGNWGFLIIWIYRKQTGTILHRYKINTNSSLTPFQLVSKLYKVVAHSFMKYVVLMWCNLLFNRNNKNFADFKASIDLYIKLVNINKRRKKTGACKILPTRQKWMLPIGTAFIVFFAFYSNFTIQRFSCVILWSAEKKRLVRLQCQLVDLVLKSEEIQ